MTAFQCKDCGHILGCHDHRRFVAGGSEITSAVPLKCAKCGKETRWAPTPKTVVDRIRERLTKKVGAT